MISIAEGVTLAATTAFTASEASRFAGKSASRVTAASGCGRRRSVARVTIPRVPSEPTSIRVRSYPTTPFAVATPVRRSSPVPSTASRPRT